MRVSAFWGRWASGALVIGCAIGGNLLTTLPAYAQQGVVSEAKERAQKAPSSAEAAIAHGRALRRAGRETEALTELRRAQALAKGDAAVTAEWEIARAQIARRDFATALRTCQGIASKPNGAAASRVCSAEAHLLWRRGSEALAELAKVPAGSGPEVDYSAKLAEAHCRELESRDGDAESLYRDAVRLAPERSDAHLSLGMLLQRSGREGLGELRRAVELDAHDPVAHYELGRAMSAEPALRADAIKALERAVLEKPTFVDALRSLTETYLSVNRMADARATAASVLRIAPNDVSAHLVSGRVALADGKLADALSEGQAALKLMPNESKANLLIADAYAQQGEIDLALEAYQKASGLDPLDPTPLVRATNACLMAGRYTSAKAFGERAVRDFPSHAQSWMAKGDALAADGNPGAARTAYESAKKTKGADSSAIDAKLSRLK